MARIIALAGSVRTGSWNQKLIDHASERLKTKGVEVLSIKMSDYTLPLYDANLEVSDGLPDNARKLKKMFEAHDGFLIASPEYNSSMTPLLKNTLDWISRPGAAGELPLSAFRGKVATLLSASPGALGGLRGLVHLRSMLGNIGVIVLPDQLAVGKAHEAFDSTGGLVEKAPAAALDRCLSELSRVCSALCASKR
jgi:NAD(P)H-dependent FMN reductase